MKPKTLLHYKGQHLAVSLLFEVRDMWLGVFWDRTSEDDLTWTSVYICLVPMLPIRILVW